MALHGEQVVPAFNHCIDVAAALPDVTFSHLVVKGGSEPTAVFEISAFVPSVHEARVRTLAMIDGKAFGDERPGVSRLASGTSFADGTRASVERPAVEYPGYFSSQFGDIEPPSLPEATVAGLRQVAECVGGLAIPIHELRVALLPPGTNEAIFRDDVKRSPLLANIEAGFTSPDERAALDEWLQTVLVTEPWSLSALANHVPNSTWETQLVEGGHPLEVKVSDYSPAGIAAQHAAAREWNQKYPTEPLLPIIRPPSWVA